MQPLRPGWLKSTHLRDTFKGQTGCRWFTGMGVPKAGFPYLFLKSGKGHTGFPGAGTGLHGDESENQTGRNFRSYSVIQNAAETLPVL
jgi:hypothetical protein